MMIKECLVLIIALTLIDGQYLGFGGVKGRLTPRTGSSWPPYPGAGNGYWADKAGWYGRGRNGRGQCRRMRGPRLFLGSGGVFPPRGPISAYNRERYDAARNAARFARRFQGH